MIFNTSLNSDPGEPKSMKEALSGPNSKEWEKSIRNEIENFLKRKAWKKVLREKVLREKNRKLITTKWIFKKKDLQDGTIKLKSRVVSRGFMQIPGVDYTESFSPVATDMTIRLIIGLFLYYNKMLPKEKWQLELFDVEAAFLNSDVENETYIEWPEGVIELGYATKEDKEKYCILLNKAMYGNIDAPLCWMKTFSKYLTEVMNFIQSKADPCVFIKRDENGKLLIILAVYVDDTLIIGSKDQVEKVYQQLKEKFVIEILGALNKHLGIRWTWTKYNTTEIGLKAKMITLADDIINDYKEASGKEPKISSTPGYPGKYLQKNEDEIVKLDAYRSIVGKLIYYMTKIRPDLSNAVRDLSAHLTNPGKEHWKALDRCVGYVKTTKLEGIYLKRPRSLQSISYTDADYAKDEKDRKSISGRLNTVGGMITGWSSKKQNTVSLSSTEAEYQALSECSQKAMFTRNLNE